MSATGFQRRRREAMADEVVELLSGSQLPIFIAAASLACAPTKASVRAAVANQSDYPAMRRIAGEIVQKGSDDTQAPPVDQLPEQVTVEVVDIAVGDDETITTTVEDAGQETQAAAVEQTPAPAKPKRAKRKPRVKKDAMT